MTDFDFLACALRSRFEREHTWSSRRYRSFRFTGAAFVAVLATGGL